MSPDQTLGLAQRHRTLRWMGVPLFWLGVLGILTALYARFAAEGAWGGVMLYVAATGLSLGTFGLHNDTALAMLLRAPSLPAGPAKAELDAELRADRLAVNALSPSPKASYAATALAFALHAAAAWKLMGAL
ncbi:MAG: hypothetical protein VX899_05845 [Myxococcota bacterium]|nr:hypothetical protein [Myxococcota bacterium]